MRLLLWKRTVSHLSDREEDETTINGWDGSEGVAFLFLLRSGLM